LDPDTVPSFIASIDWDENARLAAPTADDALAAPTAADDQVAMLEKYFNLQSHTDALEKEIATQQGTIYFMSMLFISCCFSLLLSISRIIQY
jgi:hypothetical protein